MHAIEGKACINCIPSKLFGAVLVSPESAITILDINMDIRIYTQPGYAQDTRPVSAVKYT